MTVHCLRFPLTVDRERRGARSLLRVAGEQKLRGEGGGAGVVFGASGPPCVCVCLCKRVCRCLDLHTPTPTPTARPHRLSAIYNSLFATLILPCAFRLLVAGAVPQLRVRGDVGWDGARLILVYGGGGPGGVDLTGKYRCGMYL